MISPAIAVWAHRGGGTADAAGGVSNISHRRTTVVPELDDTRIAIEILEKGEAPKVVYLAPRVNDAVPEPGMVSLLMAAGVMAMFRRRRN